MTAIDVLVTDDIRELHDSSILIDGRDPSYLLFRTNRQEKPDYWPRIQKSGFTAITVDVPNVEDDYRDAAINFGSWHRRIRSNPGMRLILSGSDIVEAKAAGEVGFILSSQSPTIFENDPLLIDAAHAMGLRVMQMSYQKRNLLADGCGERNDAGVSGFGFEAIRVMNEVGIAIDLSHASDRTMIQTIEASEKPVFFSHSNARSLVDHPRNVPDEYLRALADRGGICCVSAYSAFLTTEAAERGSTLDDYLRMMDHIVKIVGIDNVGIGFDVGEARTPAEIEQIGGATLAKRYVGELRSRTDLIRLTEAVVRRGYSEGEAKKILGTNLLKFYTTVWGG